ncbi:MAG: hypothetical protein IT384_13125 [Deltaproteobacteria bacterium]|nr:hypothetical protein [Deltaproteobacteria bacterium]
MRPRNVKEHLAISGAAEKAQSLREELAYHDHRYHVLEYPLISTRRYWEMREALAEIEREGVPIELDSASRRAGGATRSAFELVTHRPPWPAPPVLRSPSELRRYVEQVIQREGPSPVFIGGARLTGVEVALTYAGGFLVRAVLRGSGREGEDVTDNARTIGSVPLLLRPPGTITESRVSAISAPVLGPSTMTPVPPFPGELVVRGIVTMRTFDCHALDRARIDSGEPPYVEPLAAIEASIRRFDPRISLSRRLFFFASSVARPPPGSESQWQLLAALKSWGFRVAPLAWRCVGHDEVLDFITALQQAKPTFEYPLDGGVLTLSRIFDDDASAVPRSVFLSFTSLGRRARVPNVYRAIGRGGAVLPVALLSRVEERDPPVPNGAPVPAISGTRLLDVRAGSVVRVLPGTVAPHLTVDGAAEERGSEAKGETCPACQQPLRTSRDEAFSRCENLRCRGRARARVLHLVGPRGLALRSITSKQAEGLLSGSGTPLVEYYRVDVDAVEKIAPGAGAAFAEEREAHRRLPLWRLLYLSSIPLIGERVSRAVASHAQGIDGLIGLVRQVPLPLRGVPLEVQGSLRQWLESEGRQLIAALLEAGVAILGEEEVLSAPLLGKTLVIAGKLQQIGVEQATDEIERRGGRVEGTVTRRTDLMVLGIEAGEAQASAEAFGVIVIDEQALIGLLKLSA